MPLQYDDIPGSWGTYSKDWPYIECGDDESTNRAYLACSKEHIVPYGSYVQSGTTVRVETIKMLRDLTKHLDETQMKTAKEVMAWHESLPHNNC